MQTPTQNQVVPFTGTAQPQTLYSNGHTETATSVVSQETNDSTQENTSLTTNSSPNTAQQNGNHSPSQPLDSSPTQPTKPLPAPSLKLSHPNLSVKPARAPPPPPSSSEEATSAEDHPETFKRDSSLRKATLVKTRNGFTLKRRQGT